MPEPSMHYIDRKGMNERTCHVHGQLRVEEVVRKILSLMFYDYRGQTVNEVLVCGKKDDQTATGICGIELT